LDNVNAFWRVDEMSSTKPAELTELDIVESMEALEMAGFVVVPRLPTLGMEKACRREMNQRERTWTYESIWLAMISAAEKGE